MNKEIWSGGAQDRAPELTQDAAEQVSTSCNNRHEEHKGVQNSTVGEKFKVESPRNGSPPPYSVGDARECSTLGFEEVKAWPEPVEGAELLDELRSTIGKYLMLAPGVAETLALWVLHTYAFELRNVTTYLGISSPEKRCGKTTLLEVLSELVNRPVVAANISPPALFRVIEEARPTLLIDEADTFLQGNEELRGILNAGYSRKTAYVVRVGQAIKSNLQSAEEKPRMETKEHESSALVRFSCWCPKVMAAIGRLPETLMDRCIVIPMQRKRSDEVCERTRTLDGTILRRKCARFVQDHAGEIAKAKPEIPRSLNDRAADIWEPLLALADLVAEVQGRKSNVRSPGDGPIIEGKEGEAPKETNKAERLDWPKAAREAAEGLSARSQEGNPISSLLLDILLILAQCDGKRVFSRTLVAQLNRRLDRPWAQMRNGKHITELWLAQQLRPYGVMPKTMWIGEQAAKGYAMQDFGDIFARYIPKAEAREFMKDLDRLKRPGTETVNGDDKPSTDGAKR